MTRASAIERMRTGDIRSIPIGVWVFIGLAVAEVGFRIAESGIFFDPSDTPGILTAIAPFLFAAAVFFASPADRRVVYGAVAISFGEVLRVLDLLFAPRFLNVPAWEDVIRLVSPGDWLFTFAGLLLIGLGLGGVRTRIGWVAIALGVAVGLALFLVGVALSSGAPIGELWLLIALPAPAVAIGWAYLLGAALDSRRTFIAIGAGMMLLLMCSNVVLLLVWPATPGTDFTFTTLLSTIAQLAAWAALIAGALTELGPRDRSQVAPADAEQPA